MMSEWLKELVALSIAGSAVLLLSILITYITKSSLAARWHYWNRKISLFFFLMPISLILSLYTFFKDQPFDMSIGSQLEVHQLTLSLPFVQILFAIWITGVIMKSGWALYTYSKIKKEMTASIYTMPKNHEIQQLITRNMKIPTTIQLAFDKKNRSPVLFGIRKPTIIIPLYKIPDDELAMIIKHEMTHFKKKDLWVRRTMLIATIIHWYNPLIYLLQKEIYTWSELSCDEDVVMEMAHNERKKYGETILNMMGRANKQSNSYFMGSFFSTNQISLKRRLMKMLKVKKMSKMAMAISFITILGIGSIGLGGAIFAKQFTPPVSEELDENYVATASISGEEPTEAEGGFSELISVKLSDEPRFPKEDWKKILKQIENGEVILEEE
ncbi:M56 family metallopeptidase [Gracilibacillus oryzae]|uniref:M56 family metallopeptidase n=1 Tax=Gracilibacillus oryzae TaxID=1672701 RepID=A0A7C8KTX7_9BACI|nr:M56 family metallopeptidase [Gracilibacillus oryzae]KAB8129918.1 M56 family metallopeptidase [Gracilibacillus oryzae]